MDYQKAVLLIFTLLTIGIFEIKLTTGAPAAQNNSPSQKEYYLSRGWGDSAMPFSVTYSNYARTKLHKTTAKLEKTTQKSSTMKSRPTRKSNQIKKTYEMPQLFLSNGWGPLGK